MSKPVTLAQYVNVLKQLDPNSMMEKPTYVFSTAVMGSDGSLGYTQCSKTDPFTAVTSWNATRDQIKVSDLLTELTEILAINPNTLLRSNGRYITKISVNLLTDLSVVDDSEWKKPLLDLVQRANSGENLSTLLAESNLKITANFMKVGDTWYIGAPDNHAYTNLPRTPADLIAELFHVEKLKYWVLYRCKISAEAYKKLFNIPSLKERITKALQEEPPIIPEGANTRKVNCCLGGYAIERLNDKGEKHGLREHFTDGKLDYSDMYENGKPNGESIRYFPNGKKYHTSMWKEGLQYGPYYEWDSKGNLLKAYNYDGDTRRDGVQYEYHSNGQRKTERTYSHGFKQGTWKEWEENGSLIKIEEYEDDKLVEPIVKPTKPILQPTSLPTRFFLEDKGRRLFVEKVGSLQILIGATAMTDKMPAENEKLPDPMEDDRVLAKSHAISCIESAVKK